MWTRALFALGCKVSKVPLKFCFNAWDFSWPFDMCWIVFCYNNLSEIILYFAQIKSKNDDLHDVSVFCFCILHE